MNALVVRLRRLRERTADEQGFSLMEVLLVTAIGTMIALPVLAWMLTAFKTQTVVTNTSRRTQVTTQLAQVLPRDVSSARTILYASDGGPTGDAPAYDCSDADPGDFVATSILFEGGLRIAVYAAGERDGKMVVVRRTCVVDHPTEEETVLGEVIGGELAPRSPDEVISASPRWGGAYPENVVSGVDVVVNVPYTKPVTVSGTLRTGVDP